MYLVVEQFQPVVEVAVLFLQLGYVNGVSDILWECPILIILPRSILNIIPFAAVLWLLLLMLDIRSIKHLPELPAFLPLLLAPLPFLLFLLEPELLCDLGLGGGQENVCENVVTTALHVNFFAWLRSGDLAHLHVDLFYFVLVLGLLLTDRLVFELVRRIGVWFSTFYWLP